MLMIFGNRQALIVIASAFDTSSLFSRFLERNVEKNSL